MKEQTDKQNNGLSSNSPESQITPEGIRAQLDRVLSSPDLKASNKVKTIFRYLTEEKLAGREDRISEQRIANKANNRPLDSDSSIDPLVRIQVNQLRRALKNYDAAAGTSDDGPRIEMPEGGYTPVFNSK